MDSPRIADAATGLRHVFLRDMVLQASIGVHPPEHEAPQRVRINVDLGVEDDGVGMPAGALGEQRRSLGFRIVGILTEQLDGSVEQREGPGTRIVLRFPVAA